LINSIIDDIIFDEGFESKPYHDTIGVLTIGYGTNIEQGITRPMAKAMLRVDIESKIAELVNEKPFIIEMPMEKQRVVFNMVYQLGVSGVLKFKKMWLAIENKDYDMAAKEMLDSKWQKQTPNRAERLSKIMKS